MIYAFIASEMMTPAADEYLLDNNNMKEDEVEEFTPPPPSFISPPLPPPPLPLPPPPLPPLPQTSSDGVVSTQLSDTTEGLSGELENASQGTMVLAMHMAAPMEGVGMAATAVEEEEAIKEGESEHGNELSSCNYYLYFYSQHNKRTYVHVQNLHIHFRYHKNYH